MYKGASRNLQRISTKLVAGVNVPEREKSTEPRSIIADAAFKARQKLAKFRYIFELEQQIAVVSSKGESVAALRSELEDIRTGRKKASLKFADKANGPRQQRNSDSNYDNVQNLSHIFRLRRFPLF